MATIPTPLDATTGVKISATAFDLGVRDPLNFLFDPPHCSVYDGTGVTAVDATYTLMVWDTETDDTDAMHSTGVNPSRIIFVTPGRYELKIHTAIPVTTTYTTYNVQLKLNSGGVVGGGTSLRTWSFGAAASRTNISTFTSISRVFAAADYVELFVQQTTTSNRAMQAAGQYATGIQARMIGLT